MQGVRDFPEFLVSRDTLQHIREVLPCEVRVTDPAHPLCGRVLRARGFRRLEGVLMLAVALPDGSAGTIAAAATSVLGQEPRSEPEPGPGTVLTVDGDPAAAGAVGSEVPRSGGPRDPPPRGLGSPRHSLPTRCGGEPVCEG